MSGQTRPSALAAVHANLAGRRERRLLAARSAAVRRAVLLLATEDDRFDLEHVTRLLDDALAELPGWIVRSADARSDRLAECFGEPVRDRVARVMALEDADAQVRELAWVLVGAGTAGDRAEVGVRVCGEVRVGRRRLPLLAWWTLHGDARRWVVVDVEAGGRGAWRLDTELPGEAATRERLEHAAAFALAESDQPGAPAALPFALGHGIRHALLDRALVDGRFAPPVIVAAADELVDAWQATSSGIDDAAAARLAALASGRALGQLDAIGLAGVRVTEVEIVELALEEPPAVGVRVAVTGRRTHRWGPTERRERDLVCTFTLADDLDEHWRLTSAVSHAPERTVLGWWRRHPLEGLRFVALAAAVILFGPLVTLAWLTAPGSFGDDADGSRSGGTTFVLICSVLITAAVLWWSGVLALRAVSRRRRSRRACRCLGPDPGPLRGVALRECRRHLQRVREPAPLTCVLRCPATGVEWLEERDAERVLRRLP